MANGSNSDCTIGVGNIGSYLSLFNDLGIDDQVDNPAGSFDTSELYNQARQLPYVMTDLLNRNDMMMLYTAILNVSDITPISSLMPIRPEGSTNCMYIS